MAKATKPTEGKAPEQYSSSAVCAALGLPRTTFDAWMLRGYLNPKGPGTGRSRLLDLETIIRLAIMKVGTDFGVSPTLAGNWSAVCISLMRNGVDFRYLHVRMYPGPEQETSYFPDDELMQDPPRPDPVLKLSIDVRQVVSSVKDALHKQKSGEPISTAREGSAAPMKFVLDHFAAEAQSARAQLKQFLDDTDQMIGEAERAKQTKLTETTTKPKKARRSRAAAPPKE